MHPFVHSRHGLAETPNNPNSPNKPPGQAKSSQDPPSAELNVFNALQVLYEYVQKTMQQPFKPDVLFEFIEEFVCASPRTTRKVLVATRYPSPDGIIEIDLKQVDQYWSGQRLEDVVDKARLRNCSQVDRERRRFAFVTVVDMATKGHLTAENQPSARALERTKHACPAYLIPSGLRLRNDYKHAEFVCRNNAVRDSRLSPQKAQPNPTQMAQVSSPLTPPVVASSSRVENRPLIAPPGAPNARMRLHELCQRSRATLVFSELPGPEPNSFAVICLVNGQEVSYGSGLSKKMAQESAAELALQTL